MKTDPQKAREWQERSARKAAERARARAREPRQRKASSRRPRRNDGPWRDECVAAYGEWCRACGTNREIQMDHMWPRGQGGLSDVRNGLPLCRTHHEEKTNGTLLIRPEWLTEDQIEFLAEHRWVAWDSTGIPYGRGHKHFAAKAAV